MKKILIFLFLISPLYARTNQQLATIPLTQLLCHINLGAGTTVYDLSGEYNNGFIPTGGAAVWSNGILDKCLDFDGADNSFLDFGSPSLLNDTTAFTWIAWVNLSAWNGTQENVIISYNNNDASWDRYLRARSTQEDISFNNYDINNVDNYVLTGKIELNKWYFVVVTFDKNLLSNNEKIYLNGVLKSSTTVSADLRTTNCKKLTIGGQNTTTRGSQEWNGYIDEIMIIKRALSAGEIQHIYNSQSGRFQ